MKLTVYVPTEIEIPDDKLAELAEGALANKRWAGKLGGEVCVPMESIVEEAQARGVIAPLPLGYSLEGDVPWITKGGLSR